ncbi:MAG: 50S ribosomal protein L25 [Candidatus Omnitrophota bacterium]
MEQVKLEARVRKELGKSAVKHEREKGIIPAIVYRKGENAMPIYLNRKSMELALHTSAGENALINLKIEGDDKAKSKTCIIKEIQHDPLSGSMLHIDFNEISLTEEIKVDVPLAPKGESIGVKQDGGVLEHLLWEIQVECLPTAIPEKLEIDVSGLKIGDALFVKDIVAPDGVKILNDPEVRIFAVEKPVEIKPEEAAAEAETAPSEPEVLKQKKPEEIAAEEEAKAKAKEKKE